MAVVSVAVSDAIPEPTRWEMPPNFASLSSPIPRGLITYRGTDAIAILASGDETSYALELTMPDGFAYLPRVLNQQFRSSGLDANFGNVGIGWYARPGIDVKFPMLSPGPATDLAVVEEQQWLPTPLAPKVIMRQGDIMIFRYSDMTAAGSLGGNMVYYHQFYVFDVDQIDKWEVNTPTPVISHTSF